MFIKDSGNTYFKDGTTPFDSSVYSLAYTVNATGVKVREIVLDGIKNDGQAVTVAMITDCHIKENENVISALEKSAECAAIADRTVFCGDTIESSSHKPHVDILREKVWEKYPGTICVLGNHELFYGDREANIAFVNEVWPHDPNYYTEILKDKVMIVSADDNEGFFSDSQCDKFEADIAAARKFDLAILFFHHISIAGADKEKGANKRMFDIVTSAADVIIGCFSGHNHIDHYTTADAYFIDKNSTKIEKKIPCFKLEACAEPEHQGNVLFITVE